MGKRIFSSDRRGPSLRALASLLLRAAVLGAGVTLAVLAFPRIVAALYAVPGVEVIGRLDRSGTMAPSVPDLAAARQGLQMAQLWQQDAGLAVELARIDLIFAIRQLRSGLDAHPLLDETIATVRAGLQRAPAQARGWMILTEATMARDGVDAARLPDYLAESLRASPYDTWLAPNRAWLAMVLWNRLDAAARDAGALQMRLMIKYSNLESLVRLAKQVGDPQPAREALSSDPALRLRFEAIYLQL